MAALWLLVQIWILCCTTYVVACSCGVEAERVFKFTPVLAGVFLLSRVFV